MCIRDSRLGLCKKDTLHLDKYRWHLNATNPTNERGNLAQVDISSDALATGLAKWGCSGPSLDRVPTNGMENSRDFWRGAVDGDGWISELRTTMKGKTYVYPTLGLCGGKGICEGLRQFLIENLGDYFAKCKVMDKGTYYQWETRGAKAKEAIKLLYENAPYHISLDRKQRRAEYWLWQ